MEEYIREKAKHKAIAIFTFNSINCDGNTSIKTSKLTDSMKSVLYQFNPMINLEEVDKIIASADRFHKHTLEL
jgi:hypothetical protein